MTDEKGRPMTYWGGKPESETPLIKRLNVAADVRDMRGENAISALLREAATALSLAQTEIKGHMRVKDDLEKRFVAHTKAVEAFLNELYAIMVDPCAEGTITVSEMKTALLSAATRDREAQARIAALEKELEILRGKHGSA